MRTALLAAVVGAALATPAGAAVPPPVQGDCKTYTVRDDSDVRGPLIVTYATSVAPALQIGVSCWIAEGGEGVATASNPGSFAASSVVGELYAPDFTVCYVLWAEYADGSSYSAGPYCS